MAAALIMLGAFATVCVMVVVFLRPHPAEKPVARELERHKRMLDHLSEVAWQSREVEPNLSTIIIDEIRRFERRELDP